MTNIYIICYFISVTFALIIDYKNDYSKYLLFIAYIIGIIFAPAYIIDILVDTYHERIINE